MKVAQFRSSASSTDDDCVDARSPNIAAQQARQLVQQNAPGWIGRRRQVRRDAADAAIGMQSPSMRFAKWSDQFGDKMLKQVLAGTIFCEDFEMHGYLGPR